MAPWRIGRGGSVTTESSETPHPSSAPERSTVVADDIVWTHRVIGGPWHERRGCRCRLVTPDGTPGSPPGTYPWDNKAEDYRATHGFVVILVEDDPCDNPAARYGADSKASGWSCVIDLDSIEPLDDPRA